MLHNNLVAIVVPSVPSTQQLLQTKVRSTEHAGFLVTAFDRIFASLSSYDNYSHGIAVSIGSAEDYLSFLMMSQQVW
jgi:hypothetical protein